MTKRPYKILSQEEKKQAERRYFASDISLTDLAKEFGVSDRTMKSISKEGRWRDRENLRSVQPVKPHLAIAPSPVPPPKAKRRETDSIAVLEDLIETLRSLIAGAELRSAEGGAIALVKAVSELNRLQPQTLNDLIDRCIEMEIGPNDFHRKLSEAWAERKGA